MAKRYIVYFLIFSIIGWIWETFLYFLSDGIFVNPGTLIGPWLPIYGFTIVVFMIISHKCNKPGKRFLLYFISCGLIEYFTSLYLEMVYHARWWDYSGFLFNINGRVSLEVMLFYSIIGGICVNYLIPFIDKKLKNKLINVIIVIVSIIFVVDFIYSTFNPNIM